jgi:hypothetical protein
VHTTSPLVYPTSTTHHGRHNTHCSRHITHLMRMCRSSHTTSYHDNNARHSRYSTPHHSHNGRGTHSVSMTLVCDDERREVAHVEEANELPLALVPHRCRANVGVRHHVIRVVGIVFRRHRHDVRRWHHVLGVHLRVPHTGWLSAAVCYVMPGDVAGHRG